MLLDKPWCKRKRALRLRAQRLQMRDDGLNLRGKAAALENLFTVHCTVRSRPPAIGPGLALHLPIAAVLPHRTRKPGSA